jgi:glycogen debranching enzyme
MGYPEEGLEVWAYPFQVLDHYQVGFREEGASTEAAGRLLLRRLVYTPDSVTRIYAGPDYVVREKLFVPIDQPGAVISYEVESAHPLDIVIHFEAVQNLMWPGGSGGQYAQWDKASSSYVISDPEHGTASVIASPQTIAHDATVNTTTGNDSRLSFVIRPATLTGERSAAQVFIAPQPDTAPTEHGAGPAEVIGTLAASWPSLQAAAIEHYRHLGDHQVHITTPDDQVNAAIDWAQIDLDQSWVCNPKLGCGMVAGYGPSRPGRRPQYDWFFGGDGLVATNAFISASNYTRAKDELNFIIRYQDPKSGMVWHELSQSAGYIDWSKYPYMFVHVDITFDYLETVARYVRTSGDKAFLQDHWQSILNAYSYCRSTIHADDHLPHIPAGKEGGDEQNRPDDDLSLSTAWVIASHRFSELARMHGDEQLADQAEDESKAARASIAPHYWDEKEDFWIDAHTASGKPVVTRRSGFGAAIDENAFNPEQSRHLMDEIASSRYQTDWGSRGAPTGTATYNPWGYTTASTSALQSTSTASLYWHNHRPDIAAAIWSAVLPLNWLDSPGHLHEVLAGNVYIPEAESVPEQTWSSAGMVDSTLRGLFGINADGIENKLDFEPHLPAAWDHVSIGNIQLPDAQLSFDIRQDSTALSMDIHNTGAPALVNFGPEIPLGARIISAECDGHSSTAKLEQHEEDEHARIEIHAPPGNYHCDIHYAGGVALILPPAGPQYGNPSVGMKLTSMHLDGRRLFIEADVNRAGPAWLRIRTPWKVSDIDGASVESVSSAISQIEVKPPAGPASGYEKAHIVINFSP